MKPFLNAKLIKISNGLLLTHWVKFRRVFISLIIYYKNLLLNKRIEMSDHQQQQLKLLEKLNAISTDQIAKSTVPIDIVCRTLLRALTGDESAIEEAKKICPSLDFANAINSVAVDCARHGIVPDELANQIQQLNSISSDEARNELCNSFLDAYRSNFDQLKMVSMNSAGSVAGVYPKMIGMDWSILSVIESTEGADIEEPLAEITFKTISPQGTSGVHNSPELFKFVCNKNQLQDFHGKVEEACNFIQKLASNEK